MARLKSSSFQIVRSQDKDLVERIKLLTKDGPYTLEAINQAEFSFIAEEKWDIPKDQLDTHPQFTAALSLEGNYLQGAQFMLSQSLAISFHRAKDGWFDNITIDPSNEKRFERFMEFTKKARIALGAVDPKKTLFQFLDEEGKKHFEAQQVALHSLRELQNEFFKKGNDFIVVQTKQVFDKRQELDTDFEAKRKALNSENEAKKKELADQEEAFQKKRQAFDDRESKLVRRGITEDIQKILKERAESFELTKGTKQRRWPIFWTYLALLALFGIEAFLLPFKIRTDQATQNQTLYDWATQAVFVLAFGITAGFFLKWNNAWFRNHADEEFRFKRLQLDILRAAWVVEMALEWKAEKDVEIPTFLIETLSRNLFLDGSTDDSPMSTADVVASAIFGNSTTAKIKLGESELSYDRKGVERLKKDKVD